MWDGYKEAKNGANGEGRTGEATQSGKEMVANGQVAERSPAPDKPEPGRSPHTKERAYDWNPRSSIDGRKAGMQEHHNRRARRHRGTKTGTVAVSAEATPKHLELQEAWLLLLAGDE